MSAEGRARDVLYLLCRHAEAGERDPKQWPDDRLRPITDEGRRIQQRVARALRDRGIKPAVLLTSPWTRAVQSAEVMARELGMRGPFEATPLAAAPDLPKLQEYVGARARGTVVALVGHSPFLDHLASVLLTGSLTRLEIEFPKSGVLAIAAPRLAAGEGKLRFLLRPEMV